VIFCNAHIPSFVRRFIGRKSLCKRRLNFFFLKKKTNEEEEELNEENEFIARSTTWVPSLSESLRSMTSFKMDLILTLLL
jgi:hypothetical protein